MSLKSISLNGDWQLAGFPEGQQVVQNPAELLASGLSLIHAMVPGNVELDLLRAGRLAEPFTGSNIRSLRDLEVYEWWYIKRFFLPEDTPGGWELVFDGLDTLATIWLNGSEVGRAANMLIPHRFNVSAVLAAGKENLLVVRLGSAVNAARRANYDAVEMSWEQRWEGLHLRKAAHQWGWDILPRAVSAGIWRSVHLEPVASHAFDQLYFYTVDAGSQGATLGVRFQFRTALVDLRGLVVQFHGECGDHSFDFTWPVEFLAGGCTIPIPGARLWWPHGYGAANLYTINTCLLNQGQVLAESTSRIGLRKLEVNRTLHAGPVSLTEPAGETPARFDKPPDPDGHFVIEVNGAPIMVKGSNWVPLDAFHSRDAGRLAPALALFAEAGCNMVRCWGGGVYESDQFYDSCDDLGLMVWQDFAFACCIYPQTEDFMHQVQAEVEAVARQLRNHPSLAVWCGDNEIDMVYESQGLSPEENRLSRQVIPQALHRVDPWRHYIPSSPYIPPLSLHGQNTPEQHLWGPRGYYKSPFYTHHSANFIGEIGYHGCPSAASLRQFLSPDKVWPWQENDEWQVHSVYHWDHQGIQRDRIQLMANQVRELFGEIPQDLEGFVLASQVTQAEAKKYFIESTRLRKWRTSGILWWNMLDGWPQFSDAVVDYYFEKKLAFEYIRRAQFPVCVVIGEPGTGKYLPVVICNDTLADVCVQYRIREAGAVADAAAGEFICPANQNWQVARLRHFASDQRFYLIEWRTGDQDFRSHYLAGTPPFDLEWYRTWLPEILVEPGFAG
jgi:beta-mannosidase